MPWLNACLFARGEKLMSDLICDLCARTASAPGGVVLSSCNQGRPEHFPPVEAACFDCARGAVPGIRRFDDGKSGLPQPPVALLRWQHADWRELCLGRVHSRILRDKTPRSTARFSQGGVHLCEVMGRGHTALFFGAPFIEGGRASRFLGCPKTGCVNTNTRVHHAPLKSKH